MRDHTLSSLKLDLHVAILATSIVYFVVSAAMPKRQRLGEEHHWGGHRQQDEAEAEGVGHVPVGRSKLALYLLKMYFLGYFSLPIAMTIANLALHEQPRHPDLVRLG